MFHILYLLLLKLRYSTPLDNHWLQGLVSRVHQRVVIPSRVEVWIRSSDDAFIASTFNPLFDAIIISEPMVKLIQNNPESGEVILAYHMFRTPEKKWFGDFIGGIILFIILTYASASFLVPLSMALFQMMIFNPLFIFAFASQLIPFIVGPIILIFLVKGAFWRHETAFVSVQEIYGKHPQVAKVEVEQGRILNEEEAQTVIWGVRDWEKSKRSGRRIGLLTITGLSSWVLSMLLVWGIAAGGPYWSPYIQFLGYLPFIVAIVAMTIVYLWLRKWDANAMGEVFKKTTDYDEPIWAD